MKIDRERLKQKIATDPDCEVEAGMLHPEAPKEAKTAWREKHLAESKSSRVIQKI